MFFAAVAVAYGPPKPAEARIYSSGRLDWRGHPLTGLTAYMAHHPDGQLFARMVVEAGEARGRINKLYWRYCRWIAEQEKLRESKAGRDKLGGDKHPAD